MKPIVHTLFVHIYRQLISGLYKFGFHSSLTIKKAQLLLSILFVQVYKAGMYGRRYAYFAVGWYTQRVWLFVPKDVKCTSDQIREAMKNVFTIGLLELQQLNATSISGMTSFELYRFLKTQYAGKPISGRGVRESYDAVWAAALALNDTETILRQSGEYRA